MNFGTSYLGGAPQKDNTEEITMNNQNRNQNSNQNSKQNNTQNQNSKENRTEQSKNCR